MMSQTNTRDFATLLEVFRIGLINRVISAQQVVGWADAIILRDAEPDYFFIELALCGNNTSELSSLLKTYVGETKTRVAGHAVLGLLHHAYAAGTADLYQVVRTMDWLASHDQLSEEECRLLYAVDETYSMAAEGVYGSVENVANFVTAYLAFYQDFRLDNAAQWTEIDTALNERQSSFYQQMVGRHPYL